MTIAKPLALCAALALLSGCGAPRGGAAPLATLSGAAGLAPGSVSFFVTYRYQPAQPTTVNGRPVLAHRYWACVDTVIVQFPEAMRLPTVLGSTFAENPYNARQALTLTAVDQAYRTFTWSTGAASVCDNYVAMDRIVVSGSVYAVRGARLGLDAQAGLRYPAPKDTLSVAGPGPWLTGQPGGSAYSSAHSDSWTSAAKFTVTPERLNRATTLLRAWTTQESADAALYGTTALKQMPLDFLLTPFSPVNRDRQYGSPDSLYALRRAAHFTQQLFPNLGQIPVADMSEADGSTPSYRGVALHPDGAHTDGKDTDVAYITAGTGNDAGAAYDWERNFWFVYALSESTGVDMVITAYKSTFITLANAAYAQGLINGHAVGRISNVLMEDFGMNHDKHMHITVNNQLNHGASRKFQSSDDVYNCFLMLQPGLSAGEKNLCDEQ